MTITFLTDKQAEMRLHEASKATMSFYVGKRRMEVLHPPCLPAGLSTPFHIVGPARCALFSYEGTLIDATIDVPEGEQVTCVQSAGFLVVLTGLDKALQARLPVHSVGDIVRFTANRNQPGKGNNPVVICEVAGTDKAGRWELIPTTIIGPCIVREKDMWAKNKAEIEKVLEPGHTKHAYERGYQTYIKGSAYHEQE
jgi:hypothetical protein